MRIKVDVQNMHEAEAVLAMLAERRRQDELFGQQDHDPAWWMVILGEEYGEMCKAVCDYRWAKEVIGNDTRQERIAHAVKEAEQVAAVAIAFMVCVMRDEYRDEITTVIPSDRRQVAIALGVGHEQINYEEQADARRMAEEWAAERRISREEVPVAPPERLSQQEALRRMPEEGKPRDIIKEAWAEVSEELDQDVKDALRDERRISREDAENR